jgi:tetratricopeptide (TPR) repeat protein
MEAKTLTKSASASVRSDRDADAMCRAAKALENSGDYEGAADALAGLWSRIGERPRIAGLPSRVGAEILLRAGALSGWLGSSGQVPESQEFAKDLISESIRAFDKLGDQEKIAEAQTDLAICYWREGAMNEARVWFREALARATAPANRLRVLVNSTTVEISASCFPEALAVLDCAAPLLKGVEDLSAIGRYHMQRAVVHMKLGGPENLDKALIENAAASIHFEQANHSRYFARVENNTGIIFLQLGRYEEALDHLERARHTLNQIGDVGTAAQVNETRARVFLAQGRYVEAERIAFAAASTLEAGGEQSLLAEALEAQGVALARLGRYQSALSVLKRAAQVAETAGHNESSGEIFLTILEELRSFVSLNEVSDLYREADRRLGNELSMETFARLRACARLAVSNASADKAQALTARLSLAHEVLKRESELIECALKEANGSVTRAAKLLGLSHQGLCYILNNRHRDLLVARAPIRVRRKSLIKKR